MIRKILKTIILLSVFVIGFVLTNSNVYAECAEWYISIDDDDADELDNFIYTGKNIKPEIIVYAESSYYNNLLNLQETDEGYSYDFDNIIDPSYYTVTYSKNCKKVGMHYIKVKMQDGTTNKLSYYILPKTTKIKNITVGSTSINVNWKAVKNAKNQISGYQIKYSKKKDFSKAKKVNVKSYKETSKLITGLDDDSTYYVKIRTYKTVSGDKLYSGWSKKKKIKTSIDYSSPSYGLDYKDSKSLEKALNAGKDCTGKTAYIKITDFKPDSIFGYNLWAGKHLNLISSTHPGVGKGDHIKIKITRVENFLGSWLIYYTRIY